MGSSKLTGTPPGIQPVLRVCLRASQAAAFFFSIDLS